MIIAETPTIVSATQFAAGLEAASRGVVRIRMRGQFVSSGWLATDSLVVLPAFALRQHSKSTAEDVDVFGAADGAPIAASIEPVMESALNDISGLQPALLRLRSPFRQRALELAISSPRVGEPVFLLHHPQGTPELMLSWGRLVGLDGEWIRYDADTERGSSGAPVFSAGWRLLGMHLRFSTSNDPDGPFNAGISTSGLVERLSRFGAWPEIAAFHRLADVSRAREVIPTARSVSANREHTTDPELLAAAVTWTIDPATVSKDLRDSMAALVVDDRSPRWMLRADERKKLIEEASIDQLREARGSEASPDQGQRVIDRILAGPPFDLDTIDEGDLPFWLQAVRWFSGAVPDLPTPAAINRDLARRRGRSRLTDIAGPGFRGRKRELDTLNDWIAEPVGGLMAVTGIGGVGKSALVAKLALELPPETVLLWLDFDRADLAPDDPVSVLSILFEQLSLAIEGLELPAVDASSWQTALEGMGSLVTAAIGERNVLLVLDGFEVAQHAPRHEEIWRVIEKILAQLPRTNVIVSGRAPVGDVKLAGRAVESLHLQGLDRPDAEQWLRDAGVKRQAVLAPVLELSRGVPLILRLAVGWLQSGGKVADLPEELPERLVEGFLYQRILDRVVDVELKPVARDILVLRYLTPDMLEPIVGDSLPAGVSAAEVFARLAREMALVGDSSEGTLGTALPVTISAGPERLILRPEVRAATVHLLETAGAARVKTIDRRAARWYATQNMDDPAIRAEHVYHLLRAGSIKAAEAAWRAECMPFLAGAEDELPERSIRARAWLRKQSEHAAEDPVAVLNAWETDAVGRIRAILVRGFEPGVADVLKERPQRSSDGPVIVYDAWVAWRGGDLEGARAILAEAPSTGGPIGRDRAVLAARLAIESGDAAAADDILASIEEDGRWQDRPQAILDATTVTAARLRLTIDLDAELRLLRLLLDSGQRSNTGAPALPLPSTDVVLPMLTRRLSDVDGYESLGESIPIPISPADYPAFVSRIDERRRAAASRPLPMLASPLAPSPTAKGWAEMEATLMAEAPQASPDTELWAVAAHLESLAYRRWSLVTLGPFLSRACEVLRAAGRARDPQPLAIGGILSAFGGNRWTSIQLFHPDGGPLGAIVSGASPAQLPLLEPPPTLDQLMHAAEFLDSDVYERRGISSVDVQRLLSAVSPNSSEPGGYSARVTATGAVLQAFQGVGAPLDGIGVYLLSPDPLDVLVRRVLGVPDQLGR